MEQALAQRVDSCGDLAAHLGRITDQAFAVTGQPVSHLVHLLGRESGHLALAVNEKSAVDSAVGVSAAGGRSCVVIKHCGLAFALDSLANAAVHGIGAGLLVVSGDDCDASSSTCIFDSRQLAAAARLPVLDLTLDGDAGRGVVAAMQMSEAGRVPVVVRVTGELHGACLARSPADEVTLAPMSVYRPARDIGVDRHVAHGLTKLGRYQWHRLMTMPALRRSRLPLPLWQSHCANVCNDALIAAGAAQRYVPPGDFCRMIVRGAWPVPTEVLDFARSHQRVLVVEEPMPYLEAMLGHSRGDGQAADVVGRLSGHLPPEGLLTTEAVADVLAGGGPRPWTAIARKTTAPGPVPPYHTLFEAVGRLRRAGAFVATDVGSSVRLCYPPYNAAAVALSLGSAIGVASGAAQMGYRSVAVLGDYALTHSGLAPLLECVERRLPVVTVVLANGTQEQTGGQPVPAADRTALVRACGISVVSQWRLGSADEAFARLTELLRGRRPAVLFVTTEAS